MPENGKNKWLEVAKVTAIIVPIAASSLLSVMTHFRGEPGAKKAYEILSERTNELLENQKKFEENQRALETKILKVEYFQLGLFEGREQTLLSEVKPNVKKKVQIKPMAASPEKPAKVEPKEPPRQEQRMFEESNAPKMKRLPDKLEGVQRQEQMQEEGL